MAKFPRFRPGGRSSAAVAPGAVDTSAGDLVRIGAAALSAVGRTLQQQEIVEARKIQKAIRDKKAIVDTVAAGRMAGDFSAVSRAASEDIQKDFLDDPENAAAEYNRQARDAADTMLQNAPNTAVGIQLARASTSEINSESRRISQWAFSRQTQIAQENLQVTVNRTTEGAENLFTTGELGKYLKGARAELLPHLKNVQGAKAEATMRSIEEDGTEAYFFNKSHSDPINALAELDAPSGPQVDFLTSAKRQRLRKLMRSSLEGLGKVRQDELLKAGVSQNSDIVKSLTDGSLDSGTVWRLRRSMESQKASILEDNRFNDAQAKAQTEIVDERVSLLNAADNIRRRSLKFDGTDDILTVNSLRVKQDELFTQDLGAKGQDLLEWVKQQRRVMEAISNKKLSQSSADKFLKEMALRLDDALEDEGGKTGSWWRSRTAREAGNQELNSRVEFKNAPPEKQAAIRLDYIEALNQISESGTPLSEGQAVTEALTAMSFHLKIRNLTPGR